MTLSQALNISHIAAEVRITASRLSGNDQYRMAMEYVLEVADFLHITHGDALFVPDAVETACGELELLSIF